jgi:hypothetical protein
MQLQKSMHAALCKGMTLCFLACASGTKYTTFPAGFDPDGANTKTVEAALLARGLTVVMPQALEQATAAKTSGLTSYVNASGDHPILALGKFESVPKSQGYDRHQVASFEFKLFAARSSDGKIHDLIVKAQTVEVERIEHSQCGGGRGTPSQPPEMLYYVPLESPERYGGPIEISVERAWAITHQYTGSNCTPAP